MAKKKTVIKKSRPNSPKKNSTVKKKRKTVTPKKKTAPVKKAATSKTGRIAAKKSAGKAKPATTKKVAGKKPVAKKSASKPVSRTKTTIVKKKAAKAAIPKVAKKIARPAPKKGNSPKPSAASKVPKKLASTTKKTAKTPKPVVEKVIAKPKIIAKTVTKKATAPIAKPTEAAAPAKAIKNSPAVPLKEAKKPLKQRVQMEFNVRSAPTVLYDLISTPSGFAEWYCVDVDVQDDQYTFKWEDGEEEATTLIGRKLGEVIRFHRNDDEDDPDSFFEFRIRIDDMTNDVALIVTDHAWPREVESVRNLWNTQIGSLIRVLGA